VEEHDDFGRAAFAPLFDDIETDEDYPKKRPHLAHYTSVEVFEQIVKNDEIWFSNPLFMNDWQEMRWGLMEGMRMVLNNEGIKAACGEPERVSGFLDAFERIYEEFEEKQSLDVYILCLSRFEPVGSDGLLSMWRGYCSNGGGIALVLDTGKLSEVDLVLILSKVVYASDAERHDWLEGRLALFADLLKRAELETGQLWIAAYWLFERLKLFAIFSKHHGFREEQEWRAVYMPDRDQEGKLKDRFSYAVTPRGVQPKLKLPIARIPIAELPDQKASLEKFLSGIILGPTISSPLAKASMDRMLDCLKRPGLKNLVRASGIPFRSF
jgi:hypothetical protein